MIGLRMRLVKVVNMKWFYIEKSNLNEYPEDIINSRKLGIKKIGNQEHETQNIYSYIKKFEPNTTAGGMFFVTPEEDNDYHLDLLESYFGTKTVRFLMYITKGFDVCVRGFENVPDYTYFIDELNGELFTDEFLYKKFGFSEELIEHIENLISEINIK